MKTQAASPCDVDVNGPVLSGSSAPYKCALAPQMPKTRIIPNPLCAVFPEKATYDNKLTNYMEEINNQQQNETGA